jgi:hypothetical protein
MSKEQIKKSIQDCGWHALSIFDPNGEHQDFSYTIGLEESYGHPEIIIFGLKKETSHAIFSDLVLEIKSGIKFEPNVKLKNVINGNFEVLFKPIIHSAYNEYLGTAVNYYGHPFRALVMFWPDKNNILPTEPGCELSIQNEALTIV